MDNNEQRARKCVAGLAAAVALVMAGCASTAPPPVQQDPAMVSLAAAADSIHADLNLLAQIRQQQTGLPQRTKTHKTPATGKVALPITLKWSGPLEPAAEIVAEMAGYTFKVVGNSPANPVLVNLEAMGKPAFEVIEDMGWQAGSKVGVVLNQKIGELQVVYVGRDLQ